MQEYQVLLSVEYRYAQALAQALARALAQALVQTLSLHHYHP